MPVRAALVAIALASLLSACQHANYDPVATAGVVVAMTFHPENGNIRDYVLADGRALTVNMRNYRDTTPPEVGDLLLMGDEPRPWLLRAPEFGAGPPKPCYVLFGDGTIRDDAVEFDVVDRALHLRLTKLTTFDNFHGRSAPGTVLDFGLRLCLDQNGRAAAYW